MSGKEKLRQSDISKRGITGHFLRWQTDGAEAVKRGFLAPRPAHRCLLSSSSRRCTRHSVLISDPPTLLFVQTGRKDSAASASDHK